MNTVTQPSAKHAVVSGANRGLGLELTRLLADAGFTVHAGYRAKSRSAGLFELAQCASNVLPLKLDVTSAASVDRATSKVISTTPRLSLLVNNAGILRKPGKTLSEYDASDLLEHFTVNTVGAHLLTEGLAEIFADGTKVLNISSEMGSVSNASNTTSPYRISKAALNMLTKLQSQNFRERGVIVACVHPGWVRTEMGGQDAPLTAQESAVRLLRFIERLSQKDNGKFLTVGGQPIPY